MTDEQPVVRTPPQHIRHLQERERELLAWVNANGGAEHWLQRIKKLRKAKGRTDE